jgi:hypothetical protein
MKQLETKTVRVTPKMAAEWVDKYNANNRPLSHGRVMAYAADMKAGDWKLNGEPLIFGKTRMIDGQHRLYACVEADVPFDSLVVEGVSDDVFDTVDTGKQRSGSDVLSIAGLGTNATTVAAAATLCVQYLRGGMTANRKVTRPELREFVEAHHELGEWVAAAKKTAGWSRSYAAPCAAVAFLGGFKFPDKAHEFVTKFTTGEHLSVGSPILTLRERIRTEKNMQKPARFALFVLAWNAHVDGRKLSKMQSPRADEFPTIKGARKAEQ